MSKEIENDRKFLQNVLASAVSGPVNTDDPKYAEGFVRLFNDAEVYIDDVLSEYEFGEDFTLTDGLLKSLRRHIMVLEIQESAVLAAGRMAGKSNREMASLVNVSAPTIAKRITDENLNLVKSAYAKALRDYADRIEGK